MHRPIPGARFIACVFAGASLFGGAAALADASLLGLTQFVAVPTAAPGPVPVDPESVVAKAASAKAVAKHRPREIFDEADIPTPRLRPHPLGANDNAG